MLQVNVFPGANCSLKYNLRRFIVRTLCAIGVLAWLTGPTLAHASDPMKDETLERIKRATVYMKTAESKSKKADTVLGTGSGFFVNSTGLLVTNNHVVDPTDGKSDEEKQRFHYNAGKLTWLAVVNSGVEEEEATYECDMVYQNEPADQAVLQCHTEEGEKLDTPDFLRLLPESRLKSRMKAWALGFPGGQSQSSSQDKQPQITVTEGHILDAPRTPGGRIRKVFTDVPARPGNSGGPMVDADGFVIGLVTQMDRPEGREVTAGVNDTALSPAKLTHEMIYYAYTLGKMPKGVDFTPFVKVLKNHEGRVQVTEYERQRKQDVVFFANGDRVFGELHTKSITWESPLGTIQVPVSAAAYVLRGEENSHLILEGGDILVGEMADEVLKFSPQGGAEQELNLYDLKAVGMRTQDHPIREVNGKMMVFNSDLSQLTLSDVSGSAALSGLAGNIKIPLEDIERIDVSPEDDDERIVMLTDGRRMTGAIEDAIVTAKVAATDTPIKFDLGEVRQATIEVRRIRGDKVAGLDLAGIMNSADREVKRIAAAIEHGDVKKIRPSLDELLKPTEFRKLTNETKEQLSLLDGVALLREGKYGAATKALRKASRSEDKNIEAYALACDALLKRFDSKYNDQPISDPMIFANAGEKLSNELLTETRDTIKDLNALQGESRGDYMKVINAARKQEDEMRVAAVFVGPAAEDEMIRMWKLAISAGQREIARIDQEIEEQRSGGTQTSSGRSGGRGGSGLLMQRQIEDLQKDRENAVETIRSYVIKLFEYGFHIEDPDIQAMREREFRPDDE